MKSFAVLLLPLLITVSGSKGPDTYNLVVDGVDDQLDCTLNDAPVAHFGYGGSGVTALRPTTGHNTLICTPKDAIGSGGHACWAYKYRLFRNWDEIVKAYSSCCSAGCPAQPSPVRTDFDAR